MQNTPPIDLECPECGSKLSTDHEFMFVEHVENWRLISRKDDRLFVASDVAATEGVPTDLKRVRCTECHHYFPFPTNVPFEFE